MALTFNDIPGTGDIKVLNYALALEALEADLYAQALQRLTTGGTNAGGTAITGLGIAASQPDVSYIQSFGRVEREHRDFLNGALGNASIIGSGTNGILRNATFDFNIQNLSRNEIINLLYTVENLGTMAYLGAIKYFATKTFLLQAGAIQATEARHTAVIAAIANSLGITPVKPTAPLAGQTTTILGTPNTAGIDGTLDPNEVLPIAEQFLRFPS
jgi:hypothetical protein